MATGEASNICSVYLAETWGKKIANREQNVKAESDQSANYASHRAHSNTEQLQQRQRAIQSKGNITSDFYTLQTGGGKKKRSDERLN